MLNTVLAISKCSINLYLQPKPPSKSAPTHIRF